MNMTKQDFNQIANGLVDKEIEVITTEGTYTGTLLFVGNDTIILRTRIRGRIVRFAIRIAAIVGLFRFRHEHREPFWGQPMPQQNEEESSEFKGDNPQV
jgi:hypothetical protein